jgi:hypothetical protein
VLTAVNELSLPGDLGKGLQQAAEAAWDLTISGGDNPYSRAGAGIGGISRLRTLLEQRLGIER